MPQDEGPREGKAGLGRVAHAGAAPWASLHVFSGPRSPCQAVLCSMHTLLSQLYKKHNSKYGHWLSRRIESAMSQTNPSMFSPFSAVRIILKQREEALNEPFLQWHRAQCF